MKSRVFFWRCLVALVSTVVGAHSLPSGMAATTNVFFTGFEPSEGYNTNLDLVGQGPWTGSGSGGNGIVADFFPGQGQQAYVGYSAPNAADDQLVVWPTNQLNPVAAGFPMVTFSTRMQIADSSNTEYDYFQWRVYNPQGQNLFLLDFDNYNTNVNYLLDGTNDYTDTGVLFAPNETYTLVVTMNFASNLWSATLGDSLLATNLPITTTGAALEFGDMDAAWLPYDPAFPGDNFLLFDDYRITADSATGPSAPSAALQFLGRTSQGWALVRVFSQNGSRWSVDATTNFADWTALATNTVTGASFDQVDATAPPYSQRFYRARLVP
jgi:hypothetical protein